MKRSLFAALMLAGAWAFAADVEPDDIIKDRKAYIPQRKHDPLKGKTVALLVDDVKAYMGFDGRGGPPDAMGLSLNNNSYRWIYVPTPDAAMPLISGLTVEVGEKGDKKKTYPKLGMANPTFAKGWGINVPYSLVEVEVNDGDGAPPGEAFVATKVTRLDGSKKYPLDVTKCVEKARERYKADSKAMAARIEKLLEAEGKKVLKDRKVTGPRETAQLEYMTWLTEKETLRVAFRTRVSDGSYSEVEGRGFGRPGPVRPAPVPPVAKGAAGKLALRFPPPPPPPFKVKVGVTFGVEYGFAYEFDKEGKQVKRQELKPEGFSHELQPPPGLGGPRGGPKGAPAVIGD
jgi:hypothetical protein